MPTTAPMGLTRRFSQFISLSLFIFMAGRPLYGQSGPVSVAAELQSLERTLGSPGLTVTERQRALVWRARLFSLTGNLKDAAASWLQAAFADPENWDDGCFLEVARCFIALGEFEKAETHIKTVLLTGKETHIRQARYLGACVELFRTGNTRILQALLEDPAFADKMPAILYTLWYVSGAGTYKNRLLAEYAGSPEARILQGEYAALRPSAQWFLYAGREGVRQSEPVPLAAPTALQTGLFGSEANARAMVTRLRAAGFTGTITVKNVRGVTYWAVTVPAGTDAEEMIRRLKNAGFESFIP